MIFTDATVPIVTTANYISEIPSVFKPSITYPGDSCCTLYGEYDF